MAYIRLADAGAGVRSLPIVIQDLDFHASTYTQLLIICTDGQQKLVSSGGGGGGAEYYSSVVTFDLLRPDSSYGFRVESIYGGGKRNIPASGWEYFSTKAENIPPPIEVGNVSNIVTSAITTNSFNISWSAATNATSYGIQYRVDGTSSWTDRTTSNRYYTVSGLSVATYYQYRVRGHNGSSIVGSWSSAITVRTQDAIPSKLNWSTFYTGNNFTLTAKNWNDLTSKINAWRAYRGLVPRTMATVRTGDELTAAIFNDVVARLNELNPSGTVPSTVKAGDSVTAAKINALGTAIDSLTS